MNIAQLKIAARYLLQYFLGLSLLITAIGKLLDIQGFAAVVESYQIFLGWITAPMGLALALTELILAVGLLSGRKLKEAALASILLHTIFILWVSLALYRGLELSNCGCFGVFWARPLTFKTLLEDLGMLIASLLFYVLEVYKNRYEPTRRSLRS